MDSGNLLGALWALAQGISERLDTPLMDGAGLRGLNDAVALLRASLPSVPDPTLTPLLDNFAALLSHIPEADTPGALETLVRAWRALRQPAQALADAVHAQGEEEEKRRKGEKGKEEIGDRRYEIREGENSSFILHPSSFTYWADKIQQQVEAWNIAH